MNNGRDCPHGRQVGKCDTCDLIKAELELQQVTADRDALAAQVVMLKKIAYNADGARQSNSECNYGDEKEWLRHLYNGVCEYDCTDTPEQHLAAHDAEVAAKAVLDFANHLVDIGQLGSAYPSEEYAAQLRAKAGA